MVTLTRGIGHLKIRVSPIPTDPESMIWMGERQEGSMSDSITRRKLWSIARWVLVLPGALCAGMAAGSAWIWFESTTSSISSQPTPDIFVYPTDTLLAVLALALAGAFIAPRGRPVVFLSLTGVFAALMARSGDLGSDGVAFLWVVVIGFPIVFWGPKLAARRKESSQMAATTPPSTKERVWTDVQWVLVVPGTILAAFALGWFLTFLLEGAATYMGSEAHPVVTFLDRLVLVAFFLATALTGAFIAPSARRVVFLVLMGVLAVMYMVNGEWIVEGVALCFAAVIGLSILHWAPRLLGRRRGAGE